MEKGRKQKKKIHFIVRVCIVEHENVFIGVFYYYVYIRRLMVE